MVEIMIDFVRRDLCGVPDDQNVAQSIFHCGGTVTAKQIRDAISGRPGTDHVVLGGNDPENPTIDVRRTDEFPKFYAG
jgi:hypothetical protein